MDNRFFVAEENCKRLDVFLSEQMEDFTRSHIKKLIDGGRVAVNGSFAKAGADIKTGDEISVEIPDAAEYSVKPENIPIEIVYQDKDFAVVNKPQGMTVHIGNGNTQGTLVNALLYALDSLSGIGGGLRPGIVHRIDKDTSGLLVRPIALKWRFCPKARGKRQSPITKSRRGTAGSIPSADLLCKRGARTR